MGAGRNAATTLETLSQSLVECLQCPIYGSEGVLGVERKTSDKFIPSRILLSHYGLALLALLLKKEYLKRKTGLTVLEFLGNSLGDWDWQSDFPKTPQIRQDRHL